MPDDRDDIIAEEIRNRLRDDGEVDAPEIEVRVHDGTATLSGPVTDRRAIAAALAVAHAVDGVRAVVNDLELDKSIHGTLSRSRDRQREVLDELDDEPHTS